MREGLLVLFRHFFGALNTAFDVKYHFFQLTFAFQHNASLCMATAFKTPKAHTVIYTFLLILKTDLIAFLLLF